MLPWQCHLGQDCWNQINLESRTLNQILEPEDLNSSCGSAKDPPRAKNSLTEFLRRSHRAMSSRLLNYMGLNSVAPCIRGFLFSINELEMVFEICYNLKNLVNKPHSLEIAKKRKSWVCCKCIKYV